MSYIKSRNRWIRPIHWAVSGTSQAATAGTVYMVLFEVEEQCTVDAVSWANAGTVAGNATVGIYGPIATEETCNGAAVVAQSASTATTGVNTSQVIAITASLLRKGRYYAAVEFDDSSHTFMRVGNQAMVVGLSQTYARGGGYGALTDPCPSPTNTGTAIPAILVRCSA